MTAAITDLDAAGDQPAELRAVRDETTLDLPAAQRAVSDLLRALGRDPSSVHLRGTPRRVAAAFAELLAPEPFTLTTFPNDENYDELVLVKDIAFHSLCQHHLLSFAGVAHVAYLPDERLVGLSKLARVVRHFASDLQVQERLTTQVADYLENALQAKGVGVVIEAEHQCMAIRGVQAPGSRTVTSRLLGKLRDDARSRQEFLSLALRAA
jgi:GTP cyclohydrolase I